LLDWLVARTKDEHAVGIIGPFLADEGEMSSHPFAVWMALNNYLCSDLKCGWLPMIVNEAVAVATLGSALSVPIFSPSVSTSDLSDKTRAPYFMRGRAVDIAVVLTSQSLHIS
jgi:hypothetical protein